MNEDIHKKAESLITASRVEGLSSGDRAWLDKHLEECTPCAARADALEKTLAGLRSIPVVLGPAIVEAARRHARSRAHQLHEHQSRMRGLWIACVFSWLLGALSAPVLWLGFEWIGKRLSLPQPLWIMALATCWFIPAAATAAVLTRRHARISNESDAEAHTLR
jgi:anti-sigma factor RsiW